MNMKLRSTRTICLALAAGLTLLWVMGLSWNLSAYDLPADVPPRPRPVPCPGPILLSDYPPDNPRDWGPSFQAAIDDLKDPSGSWKNTSGGEIFVPKGLYPVTTGVTVDCPGVLIRGTGNPFSYSCVIEWNNPDPDAALFTFVSSGPRRFERSNGFAMRDIRLFGKKAGVAFELGKNDRYSRDFLFERVTASYFAKVFDARKGRASTWGGVTCNTCTFVYNGQVVDAATSGSWNEWHFRDCQLHKNGLKSEGWGPRWAFDFRGGSVGTFDACILEGQPRALRVRNFHGLRVLGCRFENNATSEDPVCLIEDSTGVWFRDNFHRVVPREEAPDATPTIVLRGCKDYEVAPTMGKVQIVRKWEPND